MWKLAETEKTIASYISITKQGGSKTKYLCSAQKGNGEQIKPKLNGKKEGKKVEIAAFGLTSGSCRRFHVLIC